jgi:hypothetical protein
MPAVLSEVAATQNCEHVQTISQARVRRERHAIAEIIGLTHMSLPFETAATCRLGACAGRKRPGAGLWNLQREGHIDVESLRPVHNFDRVVTMSGRVLFVFKLKDPLDFGMGVFHGAETRVDVQHEAMRVGLVVRSNELDALNPIISDGSACNREVVGLPRYLDDICEERCGVYSRAIQ